MKNLIIALLAFSMTIALAGEPAAESKEPVRRVGTYDSRCLAVAYAGTPYFRQWLDPLRKQMAEARAAGDKEKMAELDRQGREKQHEMHLQAFGTAPVMNILAHIKDQLPDLMKAADVQVLVSIWDTEQLAGYGDLEQVDMTETLVDALKPDPRQRETALEIRKHEPLPMEELEKMKH